MRKKKSHSQLNNFIKAGLTVLISVLVVFTVVKAGTITPPSGTQGAQFYTLSEIYNFITNNTAATEGGHSFTFSDTLAGTHRTLTEIYTALASRISAAKVKIGTTYLGVAGTLYGDTDPTKVLTVSGGDYNASQLTVGNIKLDVAFGASGETGTLAPDGTAAATDCLDTKTFFSGNSWLQKTGSIISGSNVTITSSTPTDIPTGYYSGKTCSAALTGGTGSIAAAGQILSTYHAWDSTGAVLQGSITTQLLDVANDIVNAGYYAATTLHGVDADLVTGNIRSTVNIFGVAGDSNVVDTSSGDATKDDILSGKIAWVDGTQKTGSIANCADGGASCYVASGKRYADECSNSTTGTKTACYIDDTAKYIGSDACSATSNNGYCFMNTSTFSAMNTDLAEGKIKSGVNIFGVIGTAPVVTGTGTGSAATTSQILTNYYAWNATGAVVQGSAVSHGIPKTGQEVCYNGVGDVIACAGTGNDAGYADPAGGAGKDKGYTTGAGTWPVWDAAAGRFTNNGDGTITDNATGLEWVANSTAAGVGGTYKWYDSSLLTYPAIAACENLVYPAAGHNDWRLPNVKELQSIVDYGTFNPSIDTNFFTSQSDFYWSSTTRAYDTTYAWYVNFNYGVVSSIDKASSSYVRCVRQ